MSLRKKIEVILTVIQALALLFVIAACLLIVPLELLSMVWSILYVDGQIWMMSVGLGTFIILLIQCILERISE